MSKKKCKSGARVLRSRGIWPVVLTGLFGLSSLARLLQGQVIDFGQGMAMTLVLGLGAWSLRRGLLYHRGEGGFPGRAPGALLIGLGTAGMGAMLAGHSAIEAIILGLVAAAGTTMAYGSELFDRRLPKLSKARPEKSELSETERVLAEAKVKLERLKAARAKLVTETGNTLRDQFGKLAAVADDMLDIIGQDRKELRSTRKVMAGYILGQRIDRVVALTERIFQRIREDPRDLRRSRKFMKVYLDGAADVAERLVQLQESDREAAAKMAPRMIALLAAMERAAEELHQKLLANDALDLDVQIEVLEQRIQREGLS